MECVSFIWNQNVQVQQIYRGHTRDVKGLKDPLLFRLCAALLPKASPSRCDTEERPALKLSCRKFEGQNQFSVHAQ